jgi:primosomal protein N' (replication factor Y) (superfamily II helicase)
VGGRLAPGRPQTHAGSVGRTTPAGVPAGDGLSPAEAGVDSVRVEPGRAERVEPGRAERVVRVVPDVRALRKTFDYTVPAGVSDAVRVGTEVRVALGGRRVGGWVVADDVEAESGVELKPLTAVRGWGPPPAVMALAEWAAWRWAGPVTGFLRSASPPRAVRTVGPASAGWDRSSVAAARPAHLGPSVQPDDAASAAMGGGTTVVRLGPAQDPSGICVAAAGRLEAGGEGGVLILAPSHQMASAVGRTLRAVGVPVAMLPDDWARARAGGCVAVGTRAAAFAPLPRLCAAVVLDAHDEAYHEERAPTWSAWVVAAERARRDGVPCALVSPCPTLDVLAAGTLWTTSRAEERRHWPVVEVVDRRDDDPRTGLFSPRLTHLLRDVAASPGRRAVCVINRTGRVRIVACAACGDLARCEVCGAALELIGGGRQPRRSVPNAANGQPGSGSDPPGSSRPTLHCRRCGAGRPVVCARCGAIRTRAVRIGVTRVREELEALLGIPVAEVWGAPGRRGAAGDRRRARAGPDPGADGLDATRVVVGTEAVLHRVRATDVAVFLEFDSELLAPRLRAGEEALALLARAARLVAGSAASAAPVAGDRAPGRVVVQSRLPRHAVLSAAVSADPGIVARSESEVRAALGLPPFRAMALVSGAAADAYGSALRAAAATGGSADVNGPVDGVWSIRAADHQTLCDLLAAVARPAGRLRVEVDPVRA